MTLSTWVTNPDPGQRICSDQGFKHFGRQFPLNTWLRDQGYLTIKQGEEKKPETSFLDVD